MIYAKHHLLIRNKNQKNPLPNTPQTWGDGKEAFLATALPATGWMVKTRVSVRRSDISSHSLASLPGGAELHGWTAKVGPRLWNRAFRNARFQGNFE